MQRIYSKQAKARRTDTLPELIRALCADYERRKIHITERDLPRRVIMEYAYLNSRIFDAAGEICGVTAAERFINEIGDGVGYAYTELEGYSESTYKSYKAEILGNIARKLHLA